MYGTVLALVCGLGDDQVVTPCGPQQGRSFDPETEGLSPEDVARFQGPLRADEFGADGFGRSGGPKPNWAAAFLLLGLIGFLVAVLR